MDLKIKREKKNLTQCQVAERVGISLSFFNQIENQQRKPSVKSAKKIAKVLDFNWIEFFE